MNTRDISVKKNDDVVLKIESLTSEASGVGRIENFAVFVPETLTNETVKAHIIKVNKSYGVAKLIEILEPSCHRTDPKCIYYKRCGGCNFLHSDYEFQLKYKTEQVRNCMERIGGFKNINVNSCIASESILRYRNKVSLPVGVDNNGEVVIGFYNERSHSIVDIKDCLMQSEKLSGFTQTIKAIMEKYSVSPYKEAEQKGVLRHIIIRITKNQKLMVIFVTNSQKKLSSEFVLALVKSYPDIECIVQNVNTQNTNVILGKEFITLYGNQTISDEMCYIKYNLCPNSFLQINTYQAEKLYEYVINCLNISKTDTVFDAYCGIGIMTLAIAKKAEKVIGVEIVKQAIDNANANKKKNNIYNCDFIVGECEKIFPALVDDGNKANIIVVDPPRKGCDEKFINSVIKCAPEKIGYISCNPATLARDCKLLCEAGYYIKSVQPFDMFPQTKHVETVVLMSRVDK